MVMTVAAPGVYVFEEKLGPRTIEAVGTSIDCGACYAP